MWGDKARFEREWNVELLTRLFNSEQGPHVRGHPGEYDAFSSRLAAGEVSSRSLEIECVRRPEAAARRKEPSEDWQLFKQCRRGGSDLHGWLKWFGYHWLKSESGEPPQLEVTLPGYGRADLCLGRVRAVIECGNTSPGHAMRLFERYQDARFIVLPFQRAMLENLGAQPVRKLEAFEFRLDSSALAPRPRDTRL